MTTVFLYFSDSGIFDVYFTHTESDIPTVDSEAEEHAVQSEFDQLWGWKLCCVKL